MLIKGHALDLIESVLTYFWSVIRDGADPIAALKQIVDVKVSRGSSWRCHCMPNKKIETERDERGHYKVFSTVRVRAEALWEELGGDLCICQRADVPHWCEKCQGRIDTIMAAFRRA